MKWILAILLLISVSAIGQVDDTTKYISYPTQYGMKIPRMWAPTTMIMPYGDTTGKRPGKIGAFMTCTCDGNVYRWNGSNWVSFGAASRFGIEDNTSTVDRSVNMRRHNFTIDSIGLMRLRLRDTDYSSEIYATKDFIQNYIFNSTTGSSSEVSNDDSTIFLRAQGVTIPVTGSRVTDVTVEPWMFSIRSSNATADTTTNLVVHVPKITSPTYVLAPDADTVKKVSIADLTTLLGGGEANTYSTVGSGVQLTKTKVGVNLPFRSLTSDTNLVWTTNTDDLNIKVAPNTLNYINYLNKPVPFTANSLFIGNSITYGYNSAGGTLKAWPAYLKDYLNLSAITNLAISGAGARRGYKQLSENLNPSTVGPLGTMCGFNNVRGTTDTAHVFELVRASHRAMAALLFSNPSSMNFYIMGSSGSVNSNISTSQSCGSCTASSEAALQDFGSRTYYYRHNDPANSSSNWWLKSSLVANETVTIANVEGPGIIVGTWAATTGWSRIEVRVDGTLKTTYDPNGRVGTYWADGFTTNGVTNDAIVVLGLRDTLHTVELKFLDGSSTGGFDYVAGIKSQITCLSTPMYVMDLPHMNATGYSYVGGVVTEAQLDSCSTSRFRDLQYYFPGYPIFRINENATGYYDPTDNAQIQSDGIHPTSLGEWSIARAVIDAMGPKWLQTAGSGGGSLDATLAIGNTSARRLLLTGSNSSNSNLEVGSDIAAQVYAPSNSWISSNMKFDGANFVYLHNGAATQLYLNNGGYTEYKNAASGSAGGTATVNTRMTITPSGDVWAGGSISSSISGTGASLKVHNNGNVDVTGNESVGGNSTISGNASAAGIIEVPSYVSMGNSFSGTHPLRFSNYGGAGGSQPTIIYYNASGTTNEKNWDITLGTHTLNFRTLNDAFNAATDWMTVTRSGYTHADVDFAAGAVRIKDSLKIDNIPTGSTSDSVLVKRNNVVYAIPSQAIPILYKGSTTWDPTSIGANSSTSTTITVTGASLGDPVTISKTSGSYSNGEVYFAYVSSTDTVTIQLQNASGGTFDIASATYNVIVLKY